MQMFRLAGGVGLIFAIFTLQAKRKDGFLHPARGKDIDTSDIKEVAAGEPGGLSGTIGRPKQEGPPHVTCFHLDFKAGGTLYQTYRTIECLQRLGVSVELVLVSGVGALADKVPGNVKVTILQKGWGKIPFIGGFMPLRMAIAAFQLRRYLRAERPEIFWPSASKVNLISIFANAFKGSSSKLVLTITTDIYHRYPGAKDRKLTPFIIGKFYAAADMV